MSEARSESVTIVTTYLEKDGKNLHEALRVEARFNKTTEKYEEPNPSKDALWRSLAAYQELLPEPLPFDVANCSWDDMLEQMKKATGEATDQGKGVKRFVRKAVQRMAYASEVISPALQMFPDDLCVLHGGLAVIFNIARYREENRQKILHAFGNIPNIIEMARRKSAIFPHDKKLSDSIRSLENSLVKTIPSLIEMLVPKTQMGKAKTAFAKHQIDDLLDNVMKKAELVGVCAEALKDETLVTTRNAVLSIQESSNRTEDGIRRMNTTLTDEIHDIGSRIKNLEDTTLDIKNGVVQLLLDEVLKIIHSGHRTNLEKDCAVSSPSSSRIDMEELPRLLRFDPAEHANDLQEVITTSHRFDMAAKAGACTLLQVPEIRSLLSNGASGLVLVDANLDTRTMGKVSPVSYFCAMLASTFMYVEGAISISFFCGKHLEDDQRIGGPRALMRSLLGQIVAQLPRSGLRGVRGLGCANPDEFRIDLEALRVGALCEAFRQTIAGLPRDVMVFCIVDGISWYDDVRWRDEIECIWQTLLSTSSEDHSGARMKVLLTCPGRSRGMMGWLGPERYVDWRKRGASSGVTSDRHFERQVLEAMRQGRPPTVPEERW